VKKVLFKLLVDILFEFFLKKHSFVYILVEIYVLFVDAVVGEVRKFICQIFETVFF